MNWTFHRYDSFLSLRHICVFTVSDLWMLQSNDPTIHTTPIPIPISVRPVVPEPIPMNDSFHLPTDPFNQHQAVFPMPTSMPIPMPISHHHQQRQQVPFPHGCNVASPALVARGRVSKACESCKFRKVKCSGVSPCERCTDRGFQCVYGERRVHGPTKKRREKRNTPVQRVLSSSSPTVSLLQFHFLGFC